MRKMSMKWMVILTGAILGIVLMLVTQLLQPLKIQYTIVDIEPGQSARAIAKTLEKQKVIRNSAIFYLVVRFTGQDKKLKQGAYLFSGKMNMLEAIRKIISGEILVQKVTVPEGSSMFRTLRLIAESQKCNYDSLLALCRDTAFIREKTGMKISTLEGFLYPDTYVFNYKDNEMTILSKFVDNFFGKMKQAGIDYSHGISFYNQLKLASIVEKEAVFADEKPMIASVYLNRLKINMLLQADPTSTYHLEEQGIHKSKLYYGDVRKDTPHNTYVHKGLPPTPICTPTVSAIQAVLKPAVSQNLFFFATPEGRHLFTTSYQEHLKKQREVN